MTAQTSASSPPRRRAPATRDDEIVIEPSSGWPSLACELREARELLYFLAWRDVKVRYKQTALGVTWAVLQPFLTVVFFTIFFNRVANISSGAIPYPVFSLAGLVPWLVLRQRIVARVALARRECEPADQGLLPAARDPGREHLLGPARLRCRLRVLLIVMASYGIAPGVWIVLPPLIFLLVARDRARDVALARGAQRDLPRRPLRRPGRPAARAARDADRLLGERPRSPWNVLLGLNPMAGAIEFFRWALIGARPAGRDGRALGRRQRCCSVSGAFYFRGMERRFADVV